MWVLVFSSGSDSSHGVPVYLPLLPDEQARLGEAAEVLGVDGDRDVVLVAGGRAGDGLEELTAPQAPQSGVLVLTN